VFAREVTPDPVVHRLETLVDTGFAQEPGEVTPVAPEPLHPRDSLLGDLPNEPISGNEVQLASDLLGDGHLTLAGQFRNDGLPHGVLLSMRKDIRARRRIKDRS
jgi:hypothetical protein